METSVATYGVAVANGLAFARVPAALEDAHVYNSLVWNVPCNPALALQLGRQLLPCLATNQSGFYLLPMHQCGWLHVLMLLLLTDPTMKIGNPSNLLRLIPQSTGACTNIFLHSVLENLALFINANVPS